ncbi:MAG TPA: sulfatase-like hydrolase/transferase [Thermoanaerobaculia bacterium]|nr:sulfatase-like hydrolase/transferase [Thermoanaerobaculia bacterium]
MKKLGFAALAALAAGWVFAAAPPARPQRPDVLLITIDTLRADAPGFAGNRKASTPVLDRLAAQGRVFTDAHAHNVVTLPSHTNILTGLYPYQHGVRDNTGFRLPERIPTLATVLHAAGYATGAFVGAYPLDSRFGLDRGFDVYDDRTSRGDQLETFSLAERRGDEVVAPALDWWRRQSGRPRFLWVHLYDPHAPYDPPEPFASRFKDNPYLGEVAAADGFLAPLLDPLLAGKEPPCLVVVTGDHGEALGEHGEMTHGLFAYEATLKIPLVLWGPGVPPGRDGRPARHVDIFPTVLAATGVKPPAAGPARPGRSLLAPAVSAGVAADSYFEALSATLNRGWAPLRGLLRGGHKLIALPLPEAYELTSDPREEHNRIDEDRALARAAFGDLPRESVWPPLRASRDTGGAEEEARLRSLGYLGSSAPAKASYGPEDDPKRLVGLDQKIHDIIDRYSRGQTEEAVRLAREAVAERPSMALGHSLLAQGLLESGRIAEALEVMRGARARGVASDALLRQLGLTLAEAGQTAEAADVLRPLAEREDTDAMDALALTLSEAGKQREAWELLQRVLKLDPDNSRASEQLGLVELRLGHWPQARDWSLRAVERHRQLPRAWNNLGVALWQLGGIGDKEKAVDAWQQAVDFDPRLWDALWNLGLKAAELGRTAQARKALERFVAGAPARYGEDVATAREMLRRLP